MEGVLELVAGFAASGPAVFHPRQAAAIDGHRAFGLRHGAHYFPMSYHEADEQEDQRPQPKEGRMTGLSDGPAKSYDPDEDGNARVAQPEMPALEEGRGRFTLLQTAMIFKHRFGMQGPGLWGRLLDRGFGLRHSPLRYSFILAAVAVKCKKGGAA
jgi:hypothetical protein